MAKPLRVGVLLVGTPQLLDLAAVDLLYMATPEYLKECSLPGPLQALGRPCKISYIGPSTQEHSNTTSQMTIQLTATPSSPAVQPGILDVLIIPGPSPKDAPPAKEILEFIRAHNAAKTSILSICTGAFVIGYAGIITGRQVTAPRLLVSDMKKQFPEALWDDSVRVSRDGNLWTSGGITNGHDLIATYMSENYPTAVVNTILAIADITRPTHYQTSTARDSAYVLWQIIRAIPNTFLRLFQ